MSQSTDRQLCSIRRPLRIASAVAVGAVTMSCATPYVEQLGQVSDRSMTWHVPTELGVDACRESLREARPTPAAGLDASNIRLVSWNAKKTSEPSWEVEFASLVSDRDLILIQEASLREDTINAMQAAPHWSFAPGYRTRGQVTGVLTLSSMRPLTQCSFVTMEPLLRTPKATSITQYGLASSDQTLIVVNLHAVNFSLGLGVFERQFARIGEVLADHEGPIILSGDFNTWRPGRMRVVEALAERLALEPLSFDEDHRVRVLGQALDHIFVRGLSAVVSETPVVDTSDHNPITVTLRM